MHNYSVHDIPGYKNNILKSVGAVHKAILLLTIVQYLYQKKFRATDLHVLKKSTN